MNCSSQRSGRQILSQLKEATQSHQVDIQGVNAHKPAFFSSYSGGGGGSGSRPGSSPREYRLASPTCLLLSHMFTSLPHVYFSPTCLLLSQRASFSPTCLLLCHHVNFCPTCLLLSPLSFHSFLSNSVKFPSYVCAQSWLCKGGINKLAWPK